MSTVLIQGRSTTNLDPLLGNRGKVEEINTINGAACVTSPQHTFVKHSAGGYTYLREAAMGTAKSTHAWRVLRITDATGDMVYATGDDTVIGSFTCIGTDAGVVGLNYTLGV